MNSELRQNWDLMLKRQVQTSDSVTQRVIRRAEELRTEWSADTSPAGEAEVLRRSWRRRSVATSG